MRKRFMMDEEGRGQAVAAPAGMLAVTRLNHGETPVSEGDLARL